MNTANKKPVVLLILDGWGYREAAEDNAIHHARTPFWDQLWAERPRTLISGSGLDVGLPEGQFGNSEVGHMSLGSGRVDYQSITRIDQAIADGSFFTNPVYCDAIDRAVAPGRAVHLLGLLSTGGVHSHERHIQAMVRLAAQRGARVYLHAFLDGRDTPPRSALASLEAAARQFDELDCGRVASVVGRYYAMDRDNRWERVQPAYELLVDGTAEYHAPSAAAALAAAYERGEDDEFVLPTAIHGDGEAAVRIEDGDSVIFMNFRADRARELTRAFVEGDSFSGFARARQPQLTSFVMTTEYAADIPAACAYPPVSMENSLGDYIAKHGRTQLRIAETEKYAHVTFFFSGGREEPFPGEERILVPSPNVATYDLKPEMSAPEVTAKLVEAIHSGRFDLIVCNYANGDMVGHTGIFSAAVAAVEALDRCLAQVIAAVETVGGQALITADHGNCEQMHDHDSGQAHTQHTTDLVPFIYIGARPVQAVAPSGRLADVAPTLLALLELPQPAEMTGQSLLQFA